MFDFLAKVSLPNLLLREIDFMNTNGLFMVHFTGFVQVFGSRPLHIMTIILRNPK